MENEKFYKNRRDKVKEENRNSKDKSFKSTKERKKFKEGLKREYRALKRSEKQDVKKFIDNQIN